MTVRSVVPFSFYIAAAITAQSAVALARAGEATAGDLPQEPLLWSGDIVGLSVQVEAARTCGSLSVQPTINGTASGQAVTIDADNTQYNSAKWSLGSYHVEAGQRIGAVYTTGTDWAAGTTPSVGVTVYVMADIPE